MLSAQTLYTIAGGLNIEGGDPCRDLVKTGSHKKWVNLVTVLDRPLLDHHLFDDIAASNPYPLLENAVDDFNEAQMFVAYLSIIGYYLDHGHDLVGLSRSQPLRVTLHVHQDVTCQPLIDLLKSYITAVMNRFDLDNVILDYRSDQKWYSFTSHSYETTDILISLSQCAGLAPNLKPGALIVPKTFIPFDIPNAKIDLTQQYSVENDLMFRLSDILGSKYHPFAVIYIRHHYESANPNKQHLADPLVQEDFHETPILQVDRLWNPRDPKESITLIE